jgi:hypothetical protein
MTLASSYANGIRADERLKTNQTLDAHGVSRRFDLLATTASDERFALFSTSDVV